MHRVTLVSFGNKAYQLEEAAHDQISHYLERAGHALAGNPDRTEILADLEQAIADKCDGFLGKHKNVITAAEAAQIVGEMGPVQGTEPGAMGSGAAGRAPGSGDSAHGTAWAGAGAGAGADNEAAWQRGANPRRRRLMRVPSEGMMGGVCAGFAAYFDFDVVWVRLAFVLLTFITGGVWFVVWLAMLIVMPAARTPEQIAAARGEALSAREVMEMARKKSAEFGKAAASGLRDAERNLRETFGSRG